MTGKFKIGNLYMISSGRHRGSIIQITKQNWTNNKNKFDYYCRKISGTYTFGNFDETSQIGQWLVECTDEVKAEYL